MKKDLQKEIEKLLNTIVDPNSYILTENKTVVSPSLNLLIKSILTENKNIEMHKVRINKYLYYTLEKVSDTTLFLRRVLLNDNESISSEVRTELTKEDMELVDESNYRESIIKLIQKIDYNEMRFGI